MRVLLCCLDQNIQKYENIILMGDYNAEITENMEKKPTCFKTPAKPTCIDLIINKPGMFQNVKTYETGLSDFHKSVVSIRKLSYKKRPPRMIKYRDYTNFSNEHFKNSLYEKLTNTELDYAFEETVLNLLSSQAPFKKRIVKSNRQ